MENPSSRAVTQGLWGFFAAVAMVVPLIAGAGEMVNTGPDNVAIRGYDTVAYFTEAQPIQGKPEFTFSWQDAQWHFATSAHRDLFAADPERYAPQFGGFCSMALTGGEMKVIDPEAWAIVDGKLYLNFSKRGRDRLLQNATENIQSAEKNWAEHQEQ